MIYECLTCGKSFTLKAEARNHAQKHPADFTEFRRASKGVYLEDKYYVYKDKTSKWLEFRGQEPNKKTKIFSVWSKSSDCELGEIKWHGAWRHYCFFPTIEFETVHSDRCLFEISQFITKLNEEKKELQRANKWAKEIEEAKPIQ